MLNGPRPALVCLVFCLAVSPFAAFAQRPVQAPHVPEMVKNGRAQRTGAMNAGQPLELVISLPLRNQAAMAGQMADLYNPDSPNFHHWLKPAEFDAQFGPTQEDYAALVAWARASGLTEVAKSANHRILTVSGSAAAIDRALHIELTNYHDTVGNRDFHAPDREPSLDLEIPVLAISGLDTSNPKVNMHKKDPGTAPAGPPVIGADGEPVAPVAVKRAPVRSLTGSGPSGEYLPADMRAAYYGTGTLTGAGQTVAIFSYDGYIASDLTLYYSKTGMKATVSVTNVLVGGFSGACQLDSPCDDGEQILDIVQVEGMAPGLTGISFYESTSAVTELNQMVGDDTASVITSSWSGGDFGPGTDPLFQQMALQGQTYLNATGDSGGYNGFTYLPPGLSPYIVEVGGTDLVTSGPGGTWVSETAWADSGGGYFDPNILIPTWQQTTGVITATNLGSATLRNSPDMAAEGNFDNPTVIDGTFETGYGGTSFATPRIAGYLALVNQQSVANGYSTIGFINPLLYHYGLSADSSTYHDITSGSAPSLNGPKTTYTAVAGYDLTTGWGSPNGTGLLTVLTGPDFSITANPGSVSLVRGSGTSATVDIPITAIDGFHATPALTVSGLPAGVMASTTVLSSTDAQVTLLAGSTATLSTTTLTLTVASGALSHSVPLLLNVGKRANDDFTISATNASAVQMASGGSTVTVSPGSGLAGPIALTVSGLPTGVTASFDNASTSSTAALTFSVSIASAPGTYAVTVTGNAGGTSFSHSTTLSLTIAAVPSVVGNGGFETGANAPWTGTTTGQSSLEVLCDVDCGFYPHSGLEYAYLDGYGATHTDKMYQTITLSGGTTKATLYFWLWISTAETSTTAKNDTLTVAVTNTAGTVLSTLVTLSNLNHSTGYVLYTYDMTTYLGQTVNLQFTGVENNSKATGFVLDDISVVVQ